MDKKTKIYLGVFFAIIIWLIYADATKTKPLNWFPSFTSNDKIPYGTFVLREQLSDVLQNNSIKDITTSPYIYLQDSTVSGTYFFVDNAVNFGKEEFEELMKFVARGNDVFVSTFGCNIDTLNLKTKRFFVTDFDENYQVGLLNKSFSDKTYSFDRSFSKVFFTEIDTLNAIALGKIIAKEEEKTVSEGVNFIKHPHGKGTFYFHTFPLAFTNYNIIKENNAEYVSNVLSYLDAEKPILWDAYYKSGKSRIVSPLYYVLSSPALKWAYYFVIIGTVVFVLFKGKREQRFIPIITPLKNQTLSFTRTIANMYYEKASHATIANHKIDYFLDYIRTKLRVSTLKIDANFYKNAAAKSGNTEEEVKQLFERIEGLQNRNKLTKEELIALDEAIESFKKQNI